MTEEERKIWKEKFDLKRGFNEEEIKEFDFIIWLCSSHKIDNDLEMQKRLYNLIKSIIKNDKLDYLSKLDKLNIIVRTNISLNEHCVKRWEF